MKRIYSVYLFKNYWGSVYFPDYKNEEDGTLIVSGEELVQSFLDEAQESNCDMFAGQTVSRFESFEDAKQAVKEFLKTTGCNIREIKYNYDNNKELLGKEFIGFYDFAIVEEDDWEQDEDEEWYCENCIKSHYYANTIVFNYYDEQAKCRNVQV